MYLPGRSLSSQFKRKKMKKTATTPKSIDRQMWYGSQDANFREFCEINGLRFKIEIKSDSYETQSFGRVYVWSNEKKDWSLVYSIPGQLLKTERGLMYGTPKKTLSVVDFYKDTQALIENAKKIVF